MLIKPMQSQIDLVCENECHAIEYPDWRIIL